MGYVADRWHKTRPAPGEPECGQHKGMVAAAAHGKGKRWQARYDDPNGREITSLWATKTEAEREINKQEAAKATGSWLDPKAGKVTVERFARDTWLPAQSIIGRSETEYEGTLRRYLFPEWGAREIRSIKPSEAGAWQKLLVSKYELKGTYPNRVARYVRSIFKLAVIDRVIPVSPFERIPAPAMDETAVQPPDVAEVKQLIAAATIDRWCTMLEVSALTGLRSGEIRGLRLARVDFLRRTMLVDQQLVYEKGKGLYFDELKTGAGLRTLPLNKRVVDVLATYIERNPVPAAGPGAGLIFTMPAAGLIGESTIDYALKSICKRAGVEPRHWHELRHHYASVLIAGGENPKVVQKRLGHKDVMTTLRTYSHLFAEAEERTRDVLDAAWADPTETGAGTEFSEAGGRLPESRSGSGVVTQLRA
ncbi:MULTISPECIES: site-specific integrase [unclassified Streptomyces]|uniref:tyrosine-type recombinase/integrase n=1 Tax=unclassified Streptomyces TaxID=2593676 RepID=UPI00080530B6|nr:MULTISPECIES: site-specific integrase [unclassified Streptomyces]MYR73022.1 tyrosine-type recombinase/integrase [Streptomyces sp. SID4925]SBU95962.1 Site-specific recombinase XerD [Streptomyces sp. OspMP-M45]